MMWPWKRLDAPPLSSPFVDTRLRCFSTAADHGTLYVRSWPHQTRCSLVLFSTMPPFFSCPHSLLCSFLASTIVHQPVRMRYRLGLRHVWCSTHRLLLPWTSYPPHPQLLERQRALQLVAQARACEHGMPVGPRQRATPGE